MKFSLLTPKQEVNMNKKSFVLNRVEQSKLWKTETGMYLHYTKGYDCPVLNSIENGRAYFQAYREERYTILKTLLETGKLRYIEFDDDEMENEHEYVNDLIQQIYRDPSNEKKQLVLDMLHEMVIENEVKFNYAQVVFKVDNLYTDIHVYPNLCILPIREKEETKEIIFELYEKLLYALQGKKPTWIPVTILTKTEHPHPLQQAHEFVDRLLAESGEEVRKNFCLEVEEYEELTSALLTLLEPYQTKTIYK